MSIIISQKNLQENFVVSLDITPNPCYNIVVIEMITTKFLMEVLK